MPALWLINNAARKDEWEFATQLFVNLPEIGLGKSCPRSWLFYYDGKLDETPREELRAVANNYSSFQRVSLRFILIAIVFFFFFFFFANLLVI